MRVFVSTQIKGETVEDHITLDRVNYELSKIFDIEVLTSEQELVCLVKGLKK